MRRIIRKDISIYARSILNFLEREKIKHYGDLEAKIGSIYPIENNPQHSITLKKRPSESKTLEYTISYIINGKGIPIEARLNSQIGYTLVIVKGRFELVGYSIKARDGFGNLIQDKMFNGCSINRLRQELEVLAVK